MKPSSLLLVDDDEIFRNRLALAMTRRGYSVREAACTDDALRLAADEPPDAAVIDLRMPGDDGLKLLAALRELSPSMRVVLLTGYGSIATAMEAVRLGVADYLTKPADANQIEAALLGQPPRATRDTVPTLERVEWEHLHRVLADCGNNISQAARVLGIDRRSLQRKLAKYPPTR